MNATFGICECHCFLGSIKASVERPCYKAKYSASELKSSIIPWNYRHFAAIFDSFMFHMKMLQQSGCC